MTGPRVSAPESEVIPSRFAAGNRNSGARSPNFKVSV